MKRFSLAAAYLPANTDCKCCQSPVDRLDYIEGYNLKTIQLKAHRHAAALRGGSGKAGALWSGKEQAEVRRNPGLQRSTSSRETGCTARC